MAEHRCTATGLERATAPLQQQHAARFTPNLYLNFPANKSSPSKGSFACSSPGAALTGAQAPGKAEPLCSLRPGSLSPLCSFPARLLLAP